MKSKMLFIFEGEKTEPQIFDSLKNSLLKGIKDFELYVCLCNDIYSLYNILKKDPFLDIVEVLRNRNEKNKKKLLGLSSIDISQIYLFFDYDPQANKRCNKIIPKMLKEFNNETDKGKLFISYPMVEALKDTASEFFFITDRCLKIKNIKTYKQDVSNRISDELKCFNNYSDVIWKQIIRTNLQQCNWLINDKDKVPTIKESKKITQIDIFNSEIKKMHNSVAILSAFPLFIIDYFEETFIQAKNWL